MIAGRRQGETQVETRAFWCLNSFDFSATAQHELRDGGLLSRHSKLTATNICCGWLRLMAACQYRIEYEESRACARSGWALSPRCKNGIRRKQAGLDEMRPCVTAFRFQYPCGTLRVSHRHVSPVLSPNSDSTESRPRIFDGTKLPLTY